MNERSVGNFAGARISGTPVSGSRAATMVLCVGATHEQYSAIARSLGSDAEVLAAPDTRTAMTLLRGRGVTGPPHAGVIEHSPLRIDENAREITWAGTPLTLCAREFDLLATLAREWGRVWSFAELTEAVWKRPYIGDSDAVISAVKRLRRRVAETTSEFAVASVRGVGFRLTMREAARDGAAHDPAGAVRRAG